mgnify:CR=1 FL=1
MNDFIFKINTYYIIYIEYVYNDELKYISFLILNLFSIYLNLFFKIL